VFVKINFCLSDSLAKYLFLLILLLGRGHKGIVCSVPERSLHRGNIPHVSCLWMGRVIGVELIEDILFHFTSFIELWIVPQRLCYPVLHPLPSPVFLIFSQPTFGSTVLTCWLTNHRTSQNLGKQTLNSEFLSFIYIFMFLCSLKVTTSWVVVSCFFPVC